MRKINKIQHQKGLVDYGSSADNHEHNKLKLTILGLEPRTTGLKDRCSTS